MTADPQRGSDGPPGDAWRGASALVFLGGFFGAVVGLAGGAVLYASGAVGRLRGALLIGGGVGLALGWFVGFCAGYVSAFARESARGNLSTARCPSCQGKVNIPVEFSGREVKCPLCSAGFTAPARPAP
jgi:hypothetical protein